LNREREEPVEMETSACITLMMRKITAMKKIAEPNDEDG
jgi:hypothetical protein